MPTITAKLNNLRMAPRKVRAVADVIRGQDADLARAHLRYLSRSAARPLEKLLNSAIAGAKHDLGLDEDYLYIKEIVVDEGMKLKRFKPKGFGMVMPIQKKTAHVKMVLDELPEQRKKIKEVSLAKRPKFEGVRKEEAAAKSEAEKRPLKNEPKPRLGKELVRGSKRGAFGGIKTLGRKIFRRKSI